MIGFPRFEYEFPKGEPWPMKAVWVLYFTDLSAWIAATYWGGSHAPHDPIAHYTFPMHYKGVHGDVFVPQWLGYYEYWGFGLLFVLLGLYGLLLWWYVRTGRAVVIHRK